MRITALFAKQILDSRGYPTLSTTLVLNNKYTATFDVPSGKSTGIHEACELRDHQTAFQGYSVSKAVNNTKKIAQQILQKSFTQQTLDALLLQLDNTPNKSHLGANTLLGISIAFCKAYAQAKQIELWKHIRSLTQLKSTQKSKISLYANVINGGSHAHNTLSIQEFLVITHARIPQAIEQLFIIFKELELLLQELYPCVGYGDEGGLVASIPSTLHALKHLHTICNKHSFDVTYGLDAAANSFYNDSTKTYVLDGKPYTSRQLKKHYIQLAKKFPLTSIEDPFAEQDFKSFTDLTGDLPYHNVLQQVVGDDLFVTNPHLINKYDSCANALLLKINQIGTLTEALSSFALAKKKKWHTIVSHRSGETNDTFIVDLAVALQASIKLGPPNRGERIAKYNRLLELYS